MLTFGLLILNNRCLIKLTHNKLMVWTLSFTHQYRSVLLETRFFVGIGVFVTGFAVIGVVAKLVKAPS